MARKTYATEEIIKQLRLMKIILISGYLHQGDVLSAIEMGVKHIVVKPFTRQQIVGHVAELLNISPYEIDI